MVADSFAIEVRNLGKAYPIYRRPIHRLIEALSGGRRKLHDEFWALQGVTAQIPKGQTLGIIGKNGSGKSTLLQILAGTLRATEGEVLVRGKVSALLELGAGFDPNFTGTENVFNYGMTLGMTRAEVQERFDDILEFSEIGEFIDMPVKTYSSGMFMRLAFSVAVHVDPEILIVDEALSVGDFKFQQKCLDKFHEFKEQQKTIILVSHSIGIIQNYCDLALWLAGGHVVALDDAASVSRYYFNDFDSMPEETHDEELLTKAPEDAAGSQTVIPGREQAWAPEMEDSHLAKTVSFRVLDSKGRASTAFHTNDSLEIEWTARMTNPIAEPNFGISFESADTGKPIFSTSARNDGIDVPDFDGTVTLRFRIPRLQLLRGRYLMRVTITNTRGITMYARVNQILELDHEGLEWGVIRMDVDYGIGIQDRQHR